MVERKAALREFNRVLADGGYVVVLEFTKRQKKGFITALRDFYLSKNFAKYRRLYLKKQRGIRVPAKLDRKFLGRKELLR